MELHHLWPVSELGGRSNEVAALQSDNHTEVSLHTISRGTLSLYLVAERNGRVGLKNEHRPPLLA